MIPLVFYFFKSDRGVIDLDHLIIGQLEYLTVKSRADLLAAPDGYGPHLPFNIKYLTEPGNIKDIKDLIRYILDLDLFSGRLLDLEEGPKAGT